MHPVEARLDRTLRRGVAEVRTDFELNSLTVAEELDRTMPSGLYVGEGGVPELE